MTPVRVSASLKLKLRVGAAAGAVVSEENIARTIRK
jgi:hypothetical protein